MTYSRRKFLTLAGVSAAGTIIAPTLATLYSRVANGQGFRGEGYGELIPQLPHNSSELPPELQGIPLLALPRGFQYTAFSVTGTRMSDGLPVPGDHDGMAAFPGRGNTTLLVRNHELSPHQEDPLITGIAVPPSMIYDPLASGGTTTLVIGRDRRLIESRRSLAGTVRNCSGGPTPWGTWITCEENIDTPLPELIVDDPQNLDEILRRNPQLANLVTSDRPKAVMKKHGYNFEVNPKNANGSNAVPLIEMGRFNHEAIAVDAQTGIVYQTEDRSDGLFYKFEPDQPGNLSAGGKLYALKIKGMSGVETKTGFPLNDPQPVEWVCIEEVDPEEDTVRFEGMNKGATIFTRGEGMVYDGKDILFCCTDGGKAITLVNDEGNPVLDRQGNIIRKGFGQVWRYSPATETIELFIEPNNQALLDGPDNIAGPTPNGDLIICEDGAFTQFLVGVTPDGQLYNFVKNNLNYSEFAGICFDNQTAFFNMQDPGITFAVWGSWNARRA